MKNIKHFFITFSLLALAMIMALSFVACDAPTEAPDTTTDYTDNLPTPTGKGDVVRFVDNKVVVQKFRYSETVTMPDAPESEGAVFTGWTDGQRVFAPGEVVFKDGDVVFKALWDTRTIRVVCNDDMQMEFVVPATSLFFAPPSAGSKRNPSGPIDYTFVGWKLELLDENGEVTETRDVEPGGFMFANSNAILTAVWELQYDKPLSDKWK
jgi:hypothetical protein